MYHIGIDVSLLLFSCSLCFAYVFIVSQKGTDRKVTNRIKANADLFIRSLSRSFTKTEVQARKRIPRKNASEILKLPRFSLHSVNQSQAIFENTRSLYLNSNSKFKLYMTATTKVSGIESLPPTLNKKKKKGTTSLIGNDTSILR